MVLGAIRPGDAESQSLRADPGFSLRLFDDRVKNLLDLQLSVRAQVRSAPGASRDDPARLVGEERSRLRAARVDPEDMSASREPSLSFSAR